MGATTYSVRSAPATRLNNGLPKPTENRSTLKPRRRATQKWPNSCTVTSRLTATMNHNAYQMTLMRERPLLTHSFWRLRRRVSHKYAHEPIAYSHYRRPARPPRNPRPHPHNVRPRLP